MIKNERQYRVSKLQLREFASAEQALPPRTEDVTALTLANIHRSALLSQREELEAEVAEYEALRDGEVSSFETNSFDSIPQLIIKARIAQGLTHKDLAELLNVKEQQVQRWEANNYFGASIQTLSQCIQALNIATREQFFIPHKDLNLSSFLSNLKKAGISSELVRKRFLPTALQKVDHSSSSATHFQYLVEAARNVSRVFGFNIADLLNVNSTLLPKYAGGSVLYKMPARTNIATVNAYTIYAHYLACVIESCVPEFKATAFPTDWHDFFKSVTAPNQPLTLSKALTSFWDAGIIVIPLRDGPAFHGAVWKIKERFVIALKQNTILESRWLFDLLHEGGHIARGHITDEQAIVEESEISLSNDSKEETEANEWAEDAIFDGDSEEVEEACVHECNGDTRNLKKAVISVAREFNVNMGCLANHMAYRLKSEGENWWATAHKLQGDGPDPFEIARSILLTRINLKAVNTFDRELVINALSND